MSSSQTSHPRTSRGLPRIPRIDVGPVALTGTLVVKWISGRNGDFAVGDLRTPIGEFRVKDALLDQFEAGEYQGTFWVSQIYSKSYDYRGRITIETRASIADLQVDVEGDAPIEPPLGTEPDPVDEAPPAPAPKSGSVAALVDRQRTVPDQPVLDADADADQALFGAELFELLQAREHVKLDPTIERLRFREQKERLKALAYAFDVKSQSWYPRG
jgi:hypothetical protein